MTSRDRIAWAANAAYRSTDGRCAQLRKNCKQAGKKRQRFALASPHSVADHRAGLQSVPGVPMDLQERVILVDKRDRTIGTEDKQVAHVTACRHRAVSVFGV